MSRWFRHYAGMMRDEKLVKVAVKSKQTVERVVWVWGAILESAAEINDGGRYEFDAGEASYFLRCDEDDILCVVQCLESIGRLHAGVVAKWSDRQFDSDSSKERQRRYRERVKAGDDVQQRNGDVGKTSRDGEVTAQETDTDTDTSSLRSEVEKKEREREDFNSWFSSWPSQASDNDDHAFEAWTALTDEERADAKRLSSAYAEQAKGGGRTTICTAATYLRKRMWTRVRDKPPEKPPKAGAAPKTARILSRDEYIAAELRRSERSFQR